MPTKGLLINHDCEPDDIVATYACLSEDLYDHYLFLADVRGDNPTLLNQIMQAVTEPFLVKNPSLRSRVSFVAGCDYIYKGSKFDGYGLLSDEQLKETGKRKLSQVTKYDFKTIPDKDSLEAVDQFFAKCDFVDVVIITNPIGVNKHITPNHWVKVKNIYMMGGCLSNNFVNFRTGEQVDVLTQLVPHNTAMFPPATHEFIGNFNKLTSPDARFYVIASGLSRQVFQGNINPTKEGDDYQRLYQAMRLLAPDVFEKNVLQNPDEFAKRPNKNVVEYLCMASHNMDKYFIEELGETGWISRINGIENIGKGFGPADLTTMCCALNVPMKTTPISLDIDLTTLEKGVDDNRDMKCQVTIKEDSLSKIHLVNNMERSDILDKVIKCFNSFIS